MAFTHRKKLTLDKTQAGASDSTDWPLAICLDGNVQAADGDFATIANGGKAADSNGYDIRPYADSAASTPLDFELVSYDPVTGALEMHVRIPTLSVSTNVEIYLFMGDAALNTDGSTTDVWDSHFLAVYHLRTTGGVLDLTDSTSNGRDLTNPNSWGVAAGQLGQGTAKSTPGNAAGPTFGQYLVESTCSSPTAITISCWTRFDTADLANASALIQWGAESSPSNRLSSHVPFADGNIYWDYKDATGGSGRVSTSYAAQLDKYSYVGLVYDSGNHEIFLDGASAVQNTNTSANPSLTGFLFNAQMLGGDTVCDVRKVDEVRISDVGRSASWHAADDNSQKPSSTFVSWGGLTSVGPDISYTTPQNLTVGSMPTITPTNTGSAVPPGGWSVMSGIPE